MKIQSVRAIRLLSKIVLGLAVIFLGIVGYSYLRIRPSNVKFTDITSNSITVSWVTKNETVGNAIATDTNFILPFSISGLAGDISYDSRDVKAAELEAVSKTQENLENNSSLGVKITDFVTDIGFIKSTSYYVHHVTISNLEPDKEYKVMVGDGLVFVNAKASTDSKYPKTFSVPNEILSPVPAYGTVLNANNEELAVENLYKVDDGVVYFNYLDEDTGTRSDVYSGALNGDGNWYIDISNAKTESGEDFLSYIADKPTNLVGELTIEAGTLGTWKKTINMNESSPADIIVLNIPGVSTDSNPEGLVRIDSSVVLGSFVKETNAGGSCIFAGYCGPCGEQKDGKWKDCACDSGILKSRGCSGQSNKTFAEQAQENARNNSKTITHEDGTKSIIITCAGNGEDGDYALYGGSCKKCVASSTGTYGVWSSSGVDVSKCNGMVDGSVVSAEEIDSSEGESSVSAQDRVRDLINMSKRKLDYVCKDPDGCTCVYQDGSNYDVGIGDICYTENSVGEIKDVYQKNGIKTFFDMDSQGSKYSCKDPDGCVCKYSDGSRLTINIYEFCEDKEIVPVQTDVWDKIAPCWENIWGNLYIGEGNDRKACENGTWVSSPGALPTCSVLDGLKENTSRWVVQENGRSVIKKCSWGRIVNAEATDSGLKAVINVEKINSGEQCLLMDSCVCNGGVNNGQLIAHGKFCQDIVHCNENTDGQICGSDGQKCYKGGCSQNQSSINGGLVKGIFAADNSTSGSLVKYVIDTQTGMLGGLTEGAYLFDYEGKTYAFSISDNDLKVNNGKISVFVDNNENGTYEEGTDTKISDIASEINISTLQQKYNFSLKKGFNFVSFPFLISNSEIRTAASLLKKLNEVYDNSIYSIAKYTGTWKVVGQNAVLYDNNDFQLIPGQGYVVKAERDIDISIVGQPVQFESESDSAPILLNMGWNLVGLYGSNVKKYTAESLIDSVNGFKDIDFTADNVTKWDPDAQKYEGLQKAYENGVPMIYGFDYPIELQKAYFVKITQGSGNWEPEIGE